MTRNNKERDNLLDQLVTDLAMKRSPSSHPPHPHLECKETVTSWQALAVLSPRILMARSKPQLDNRPRTGREESPDSSCTASWTERGAEQQTGPRAPALTLPSGVCVPALPPDSARARERTRTGRGGTRHARLQPPCRCWLGGVKERGTLRLAGPHCHPGWERRVLPLPSLGKRSWEGISLRGSAGPGIGTPLLLSEGRRPVPASRPLFECCPGGSRALGPPFQTFPPAPCGTTCCSSRAEQWATKPSILASAP